MYGGQSFPFFDKQMAPFIDGNSEDEVYQAMEAFVYNLNSMHSRAGSQVPFSSINLGTDTSEAGRKITRNFLLAYEAGLGKGEDVYKRQVNKVEICGVNTAKLPVLTSAEMNELFLSVKAGDKTAREKLIKGNLRLVLSVIQRFTNRGEYVDDLFQVGCIGLIKAIDNFDLGQNVKFSTYAVPMIIGEIRRYLRDNNPIRVSRSLRDIAYKAIQVRETLINKHSRERCV